MSLEQIPQPQESNERNPQEQFEHIKFMRQLATELGFEEGGRLDELRKTDVSQWVEEARKMIDSALPDQTLHHRYQLGYLIVLASIHYEQRDAVEYSETIDEAVDFARQIGLDDLAAKLDAF